MSRSLLTLTCFAVCLWGNATAIDAHEQLARQLLSFAATEIEQPAASSQEQLRAARKPVVGQRQSGGAISRQEHPTTPLPVLQISQVTNAGPKHQKSTILRSSIQQQVEAVVQNNASPAKNSQAIPHKASCGRHWIFEATKFIHEFFSERSTELVKSIDCHQLAQV